MSMSQTQGGGGGGATGGSLSNEPNVTPMIDVLLVLLIIFMAVLPSMRKAIDIQLPDPNPTVQPANQKNDQIVLEVNPGGKYAINTKQVSRAELPGELKGIYEQRPEKIIFVKGVPGVKYADIIDAMDVARGAGVKVIGVPPKDTPGSNGAPAPAAK
jgi:biopolymer transport protein ExbD